MIELRTYLEHEPEQFVAVEQVTRLPHDAEEIVGGIDLVVNGKTVIDHVWGGRVDVDWTLILRAIEGLLQNRLCSHTEELAESKHVVRFSLWDSHVPIQFTYLKKEQRVLAEQVHSGPENRSSESAPVFFLSMLDAAESYLLKMSELVPGGLYSTDGLLSVVRELKPMAMRLETEVIHGRRPRRR